MFRKKDKTEKTFSHGRTELRKLLHIQVQVFPEIMIKVLGADRVKEIGQKRKSGVFVHVWALRKKGFVGNEVWGIKIQCFPQRTKK